jgi:hypothetical protein
MFHLTYLHKQYQGVNVVKNKTGWPVQDQPVVQGGFV